MSGLLGGDIRRWTVRIGRLSGVPSSFMRRRGRFGALVLTAIFAIFSTFGLAGTSNIVSKPVGFVRIRVPAGEQRLAAMPFRAFDDSIDAVLGGQLSGSTNAGAADRIFQWDSVEARYIEAIKSEGDSESGGVWFADAGFTEPSALRIQPGDGFWIDNRQNIDQDVLLGGRVVLDASNVVAFLPSLNLFGYPYSTAIPLDRIELWRAAMGNGDTIASDSTNAPLELGLGNGYWYNRRGTESLLWVELRPYADVFPSGDNPPQIAAINVIDHGKAVSLSIVCAGVPGEKLDIFYRDVEEGEYFDTTGPWLMGEADIAVNGEREVEWRDSGSATRSRPDETFARYYLAGRADIDGDHNGIADGRERFLGLQGAAPASASGASAVLGISSNSTVSTPRLTDRGSNNVTHPRQVSIGRIVYVDKIRGDDRLSGRAAKAAGSHGPKRTVKSGLQATDSGDTLVIREGNYAENLNIAGKTISVRIEGKVNLSGKSGRMSSATRLPIASNSVPRSISATNWTVTGAGL